MESPTDAEEAMRPTKEKENFQRLTRLLMCGGVRLLREKFDSFHSPTDLPLKLGDPTTKDQLKKAKLTKPMWDCLYPSSGTFGQSSNFDITLTFRLLRTICNLTEPPTGWDNLPSNTDNSLEANLARIKFYRNSVYAHNSTMEISDSEFSNLWREISEALLRIAGSIGQAKRDEWKNAIDKLLHDPLTTEARRYVDEFRLWYKNDMQELKGAVKELQHVSIDIRDGVSQVSSHVQQVSSQVHQLSSQVRDQNSLIEQLNQNLGFRSVVICFDVKSFQQRGQLITPSHLPMTQGLQVQAESQRMCLVQVPLIREQQGAEAGASEGHPETNHQVPPTELTIWTVILSFKASFNVLLEYLKNKLGVDVENYNLGSLSITVKCGSLQILEGLWEDYNSGHLNKVAEETLVTAQVYEKLGLDEVKLKTTIRPDDYRKGKEFFLGTTDQSVKEEEELFQLRRELMNYDFQKCPRIKQGAFLDLDVDDIDLVRIAVIGPAGAGKTSLVGTIQRALKQPQTATDPDLERLEGGIVLEEHYLQNNIRLLDTRGFFLSDDQLEEELLNILSGRLRPGDQIVRNYDEEGKEDKTPDTAADPSLSKHAHAVIFVLKGNDPCLMDGKYMEKLQAIRELLNKEGYIPVTAITFPDDLIFTKEDEDAVLKMGQRTTGSSSQTTHFITNYTTYDEHSMMSYEVDRAALDILDSALVSAERFMQFRKQREKDQIGVPSDMESVEQFFARLQKKYHWTDKGSKKVVLEDLRKKDINVVKVLKALWEDIKSELQLSIGMKIGLEMEMKKT